MSEYSDEEKSRIADAKRDGLLPEGSYPNIPASPKPAETVKAEQWIKIKAERDRRIQNGGYKVGKKWFHSDTFSRLQQLGLVNLGDKIPANTQWKTMDGSYIAMTQALAGQIFVTAAGSDIVVFSVAEAHKTEMEASADPASYNFSTGWPKIYGD
jgi:hypothetical protein